MVAAGNDGWNHQIRQAGTVYAENCLIETIENECGGRIGTNKKPADSSIIEKKRRNHI